MLYWGNPEEVAKYQWNQRLAASAMAEAKQRVCREFEEDMEKDFWLVPRCFWETNRHLGRGKQRTIQQGWDTVDLN